MLLTDFPSSRTFRHSSMIVKCASHSALHSGLLSLIVDQSNGITHSGRSVFWTLQVSPFCHICPGAGLGLIRLKTVEPVSQSSYLICSWSCGHTSRTSGSVMDSILPLVIRITSIYFRGIGKESGLSSSCYMGIYAPWRGTKWILMTILGVTIKSLC